jgi:hypothetical protein
VWVHPITKTSVTVSGRDGADAKIYQEQDVHEAIAEAMRASKRDGE